MVRHFGKSLGNMRHWQLLLSKYRMAQNTSYRTPHTGQLSAGGFLAGIFSRALIGSNCSRLMSLGYTFLMPLIINYPQQILNRLLGMSSRKKNQIATRRLSKATNGERLFNLISLEIIEISSEISIFPKSFPAFNRKDTWLLSTSASPTTIK